MSALRLLGPSVGIAIAVAGCSPPHWSFTEASETRYSIAGYIADGTTLNPEAVKAAREALADGFLTNGEYARLAKLDDEINVRSARKRSVIAKWSASGMEAAKPSRRETGSTEGESPVGDSRDAQGTTHD